MSVNCECDEEGMYQVSRLLENSHFFPSEIFLTGCISDTDQFPETRDDSKLYDLLLESRTVVQKGLQKARSDNLFYTVLCVVCTVALYGFWCTEMERETSHLVVIGRAVAFVTLTLLVAFFLFYKLIINRIEFKGLTGAEKDISNLCESVRNSIEQN